MDLYETQRWMRNQAMRNFAGFITGRLEGVLRSVFRERAIKIVPWYIVGHADAEDYQNGVIRLTWGFLLGLKTRPLLFVSTIVLDAEVLA